ncbi:MAG: isopenicillin N synthase family dioxygenase [Acidimicrobiia bacterium]
MPERNSQGEPGIPRIDVGPLVADRGDPVRAARAIDQACRDTGFFSIVNHGIEAELRQRLEREARTFFALDGAEKAEIAMTHGGRAWRGWFPVGGELTSGVPDRKEGIYFGTELPATDPRVQAGLPLHGANQFPRRPAGLRGAVLEYIDAVRVLSASVLRGIALGLGLDGDWFERELTRDPVILFRIFHYPPATEPAHWEAWGVGEHTDYGLLTVLLQDATGGLEVRTPEGWIDVPADPDAFVCNVGDMLERMTGGRYRSTPHRAKNPGPQGRLSFPFFFDPGWDAEVRPVPDVATGGRVDTAPPRWDGADVLELRGTYGEYLLTKVGRVFPDLRDDVF